MTTEVGEALLFRDDQGTLYLLPRQALDQYRVPEEGRVGLEQSIGADEMAGYWVPPGAVRLIGVLAAAGFMVQSAAMQPVTVHASARPVIAAAPAQTLNAATCVVTPAEAGLSPEENAFLTLLNNFRAQNGLKALQLDSRLMQSSTWMSLDHAQNGYKTNPHIDSLNRGIEQRLQDCGFTGYTDIAENVYYYGPAGQAGATAQGAFDAWYNMPDPDQNGTPTYAHRKNMLDANATAAGISQIVAQGGQSLVHWTLDLGNPGAGAIVPLPGQQPGPSPTQSRVYHDPSIVNGWPQLSVGTRGEAVKSLQYLLLAHGDTLPAFGVDGLFGQETNKAVTDFQQAQGLVVDGIVGPNTWQALITTVQQDSQGQAVRAVQSQLNEQGAGLTVDGDFGPLTDAAVRAYQQGHGLAVDGIVGPQTWQSLLTGR